MKNIPKKIYLQVDADGDRCEDFKECHGVSWCEDRIHETDIEYLIITRINYRRIIKILAIIAAIIILNIIYYILNYNISCN